MRIFILFVMFACISFSANAQYRFIKTNTDNSFGSGIRILPTLDNGWVVFSRDSLRMSKFNSCGNTEWSKKFIIPNVSSLTDIIKSKIDGFLLLTRKNSGQTDVCLITRIDENGDIVWSKSYEDNYYDQYGYSILEDSQGNIILFANMGYVNTPGYNMLLKLDFTGNILWTKFYNHGGIWGGAIVTDDDGVLFRTGGYLIKTDYMGNVEWTTLHHSSSTYSYTSPVEVDNGYIYTKYSTGNNQINFYKTDKQGNITLTGRKRSSFAGVPPLLRKKANGNIVAVFNPFSTGNSYPTIVEMDKNLNILYQSSIAYSNQSLFVRDNCFTKNGECVIAGETGSNIFYAKLDDVYHSQCDTVLPFMQMVSDTVNQMAGVTNVSTHVLNKIEHNFNFQSIPDSQVTRCTVPLSLELGNDDTLCFASDRILRNNLVGMFDEYRWSTGETTPFIKVNQPGTYWLIAKHFCEDSVVTDTVRIEIDTEIPVELGTDLYQCEDSNLTLHAPSCQGCSYQWNTGSILDSLDISGSGMYWLRVARDNGCSAYDSVSVDFVKCECSFYVPNSFTPNSDGFNEIFKPVYYCDVQDYELRIYNRWGENIYFSPNIDEGWNGIYKGEKVQPGVYNYTISYKAILKGVNEGVEGKNGHVVVLY